MQRQKLAPVDGLQIGKARKIELLRETNQRGWLYASLPGNAADGA